VTRSERPDVGYEISSDGAAMDVEAVYAYLTRSYWAEGIPKDLVAKAIAASVCVGAFHDRAQVGFARVVTDRVTFAYLCDVYVLEEHRGRGLGKRLMESVAAHPDLQGLRRFVLATRDAHELYKRFGFAPLSHPEMFMEINRPRIDSGSR